VLLIFTSSRAAIRSLGTGRRVICSFFGVAEYGRIHVLFEANDIWQQPTLAKNIRNEGASTCHL